MRAIVVDKFMEPSELGVQELREPRPGPGQVCVDVRAAGCNFFDLLIVRGRYQLRPEFPFVPGGELSGVVSRLGDGSIRFAVGDRVFASVPFGAYAERVVVPEASLRAMPQAMSFEDAAALPIAYGTAYVGLVFRAGLVAGETLLVHAAAGGAGSAASQIGRALGARVIGTAGGAAKCEVALRAGAQHAIDYRATDFVTGVNGLTGGCGADVIYDPVGGDTFDRSLRCVAWNGRVLVIGFASGRIPEVRANRILLKNIAVVGVNWGGYPEREPERLQEAFTALGQLYARGELRPLISARYSLERLPEALEALASRASTGKIVITM